MTQQAAAIARGEWIDPADGERTFAAVADEWRETWVDLEPKTRQGYESILGQLTERFCRAHIAALQADVIQGYINELAETKATNTVRRYFTVLGAVMRVAVERRYLATNPTLAVRLPKRRRGEREREHLFLTPAEVAALAEAIAPHFRVLVYVAAYTGLRAGELGGLRRRNVDLLRGTLRVEEALKEISGKLEWGAPKSEASRRTVSLPDPIRELMSDHLGCVSPGGNGPDDLVFTTPTGKPMRHNLFYKRVFKPAVERALPADKHRLRFHDLRHTGGKSQPRGRAEPARRQGAARPRGHPDDRQHLRPPGAVRGRRARGRARPDVRGGERRVARQPGCGYAALGSGLKTLRSPLC